MRKELVTSATSTSATVAKMVTKTVPYFEKQLGIRRRSLSIQLKRNQVLGSRVAKGTGLKLLRLCN